MSMSLATQLLVSAMSAFLMGFVLVIAWRYMRVYARAPRDWRRLLPAHVWTIALSYDLLLLYATVEVYLRAADPDATLSWRAPILIVAYVLGVIAMAIIGRLHRLRPDPTKHEDG